MLFKDLIDKMIRLDCEISFRKGVLSNSVEIQVKKWIDNCPYFYCKTFDLDEINTEDICIYLTKYLIDVMNRISREEIKGDKL